MSRNNETNIKRHNDKLHKAKDKVKSKKLAAEERKKEIVKKFNQTNTE